MGLYLSLYWDTPLVRVNNNNKNRANSQPVEFRNRKFLDNRYFYCYSLVNILTLYSTKQENGNYRKRFNFVAYFFYISVALVNKKFARIKIYNQLIQRT